MPPSQLIAQDMSTEPDHQPEKKTFDSLQGELEHPEGLSGHPDLLIVHFQLITRGISPTSDNVIIHGHPGKG